MRAGRALSGRMHCTKTNAQTLFIIKTTTVVLIVSISCSYEVAEEKQIRRNAWENNEKRN